VEGGTALVIEVVPWTRSPHSDDGPTDAIQPVTA
jgi:hypothetical protein